MMTSVVLVALVAHTAAAFPCTLPRNIPTAPLSNISQVHPAHVSLVMAFGDSITAVWCPGAGRVDAIDL